MQITLHASIYLGYQYQYYHRNLLINHSSGKMFQILFYSSASRSIEGLGISLITLHTFRVKSRWWLYCYCIALKPVIDVASSFTLHYTLQINVRTNKRLRQLVLLIPLSRLPICSLCNTYCVSYCDIGLYGTWEVTGWYRRSSHMVSTDIIIMGSIAAKELFSPGHHPTPGCMGWLWHIGNHFVLLPK